MKPMIRHKSLFILGVILMALSGLIYLRATHRTFHSKDVSPSGKYTAIYSTNTYLYFLPMSPGSSGDKPCYVKIVDAKGRNCGEIPVPMFQIAGVEWQESGASVPSVGEWNFAAKSCFYWSEDQSTKIFVNP